MRYFVLLAAALALPALSATPVPCEGRPTGNGAAEIVCVLGPDAAPAVFAFTARFSGVHDDSQAGLAATAGGVPLPCAAGSRTRIAGEEDGDTLACRFTAPADSGAMRSIHLHLLWFHADVASFALIRE